MSRHSHLPLLLLAGVLLGCGFDIAGEEPMRPPAVYREWWTKTEACSGLSGNFDRIEWSVVPGNSFSCASGRCAGHWQSEHQIYIASDWTQNELVVRHEMLHDLLGRPGHPNPPFGHGCPLTWETWSAQAADVQASAAGTGPD
jgi:hypothetical protein